MIEIIPSILTNDPVEAREMLTRCEGVVERVSIDIIDGKFAENEAPASLRLGNLLRSLNREQNPKRKTLHIHLRAHALSFPRRRIKLLTQAFLLTLILI